MKSLNSTMPNHMFFFYVKGFRFYSNNNEKTEEFKAEVVKLSRFL